MQPDNERDLIRAWQSGSLPAAEAFVRQRQNEVRSVAYLLTLDRDQARGLAEAAFTRFFRAARNMDPDTDTRVEVLTRLGRSFLRKEFEAVPSLDSGFLAGPGPQKYGVENERGRTMAALGRFEERERVALILGEIGGFEPGQLNAVLEQDKSAMIAPIETVRQRFRHSLDIPQGQSIRPALLEAGFDGPREDLWPALQPDIAEIQRDEQRRGQLLTYGVAAGIVLVALIAIVALFGNDIFNSDSDDNTAAVGGDTPGQAFDGLLETPGPTTIPPTPTATPVPLPLADVPNLFMEQTFSSSNEGQSQTRFLQYDPDDNRMQLVGDETGQTVSNDLGGYYISPDGEHAVMLRVDQTDSIRSFTAQGVDIDSLETLWEADLGQLDYDIGTSFTSVLPLALTSERMYTATLDTESGVATVNAYDLADGTFVQSADVVLEPVDGEPISFEMLSLITAPDESYLLVFWHSVSLANRTLNDERMLRVALPDLEALDGGVQPFDIEVGSGNPVTASLAADGETVYRVENGVDGTVKVRFHDLQTSTASVVEIPFSVDASRPYVQTSSFVSHNGYHLYIINSSNGEVAAINLTEQRLERFFNIYTGPPGTRFGTGDGNFIFGWATHLSMDGKHLYISASVNPWGTDPVPASETGVWVIDLSIWSVIDFWPVEGTVAMITHSGDPGTVLVQSALRGESGNSLNSYALTRLGRVDGLRINEPVETPFETESAYSWFVSFASFYKTAYGRSPAIDGQQPLDLANYSTLPRVEASGQTNNVSGVGTSFTVRIFDPVSGDLIAGQRDEVRFDPLSTISASLTLEDQPGQLVFLSQTEPGTYSGNVVLPADGSWAIDVSIIAPDGSTTVVPDAGRINVAPTLTGSDGKRYQFRLSYDPRFPIVDEPANFRIRLAEVESGATVSSDVDFDVEQYVLEGGTIDELPARISMSLGNPNTYFGTRSIVAGQVAHGVWEGTITFADPGIWTNAVRLQFGGLPLTEIYIRTIFVSDPPPESSVSEPEFWQGIAKT